MKYMETNKKQHIFITGGTRGIGKGLVKEFLKEGHNVSFTGTSIESVKKAESNLKGNYLTIVSDVRNYDSIVNAKDNAINKFGEIDIWVNNAGVTQSNETISDLAVDEIKRVIDINITGLILGTKVALIQMKKQNYGRIYNMEGLGSDNRMYPKTVIYGSSKRLVRYFSHSSNKELKDYENIFVGTISPGMVFTDLLLSGSTKESENIFRILGNKVEEVTPFLVNKMLANKLHINWLTNRKVIYRFLKSLFIKNDK